MSDQRISDMREMHHPEEELGQMFCYEDGQHWPCDTACVLEQLAAAEARAAEWKAGYHEQVRKLARSVADHEIAKMERDTALAQVARQAEQLAALREFAEASWAIEYRYADGKALTPEMERLWPGVCERAKAVLLALAAAEQPATEGGAGEPER